MVSKKRVFQQGYQSIQSGFDAWYNYYDKLFGSRWQNTLYPSLLKKNQSVGLINPFFKRFPINPQLFHPRAEWCNDSELYGCIHVPTIQNELEDKFNNYHSLLHPTMLREKRNVEAWLKEDEFKTKDLKWFQTIPDEESTFYPYFEKLPEYSTKLKHLELNKLSWKDLDPYYILDAASVRIARLMKPYEGNILLDMCSAPGGKSLVMLENIYKHNLNCKLIMNEMGFKRRKVLKDVVDSFLPFNIHQEYCVLTNIDAKLWGLAEANKYDCILLDVPCSSDRHLLKEKKEMNKWSLKSCKNLCKTQFALLRSALDCVKIGGYVIYATCTLNCMENDELIHQIIKKRQGKVEIINDISLNIGEKTEYGMQILPDLSPFYEGPLYVCSLRRIY